MKTCEHFLNMMDERHYALLDDEAATRFDEHKLACPSCRGAYERRRRALGLLKEWRVASPQGELAAKTLARVQRLRQQPSARLPLPWLRMAAAIAISTCIVAVVYSSFLRKPASKTRTPAPDLPVSWAPEFEEVKLPPRKVSEELKHLEPSVDKVAVTPSPLASGPASLDAEIDPAAEASVPAEAPATLPLFSAVAEKPVDYLPSSYRAFSFSHLRGFIGRLGGPHPEPFSASDLLRGFVFEFPASGPLALHTELSDCPWNDQHLLLMLAMSGPAVRASPEVALKSSPAALYRVEFNPRHTETYRLLGWSLQTAPRSLIALYELVPSSHDYALGSYSPLRYQRKELAAGAGLDQELLVIQEGKPRSGKSSWQRAVERRYAPLNKASEEFRFAAALAELAALSQQGAPPASERIQDLSWRIESASSRDPGARKAELLRMLRRLPAGGR